MSRKEKHWGKVTDNRDPEKRGRVTVECPTIAEGDVLEWIDPTFHFVDSGAQAGSFWVPNVDALVEVEIEAEPDSEATSLEPKWVCSVYPEGTVPDEFKENYPERRGWKTKSGHLLYFDDTEGEKVFLYKHPTGTEIYVNNTGRIELKPTGTQSVFIGDGADQHLVRGEKLTGYFNNLVSGLLLWLGTHVHGAPGSPPTTVPPTLPLDLLSDNHLVK